MTSKILDASIYGLSNIIGISISESHGSSTAVANVQCEHCDLDVGDNIVIYAGYSDNRPKLFEGYVKRVERTYPEGYYSLTANDVLTRAIDFFIVGPDAQTPYKFNNIEAGDLITEVLYMAGLNDFDFDNTYFSLGINSSVEVNLISSYDFSRQIADIVAWEFWADYSGKIHFKNRKPYPMDGHLPGESSQPGWVLDSVISANIIDTSTMTINIGTNENDLRNKIVVYGKDTLSASAQSSTSYDPLLEDHRQILPTGFYKAAVLASPLIDDAGFAADSAGYNLKLLNKLTYELPITIEGNPSLHARSLVNVNSTIAGLNKDWYIYQLDHSWGKSGYVTNLLLRK